MFYMLCLMKIIGQRGWKRQKETNWHNTTPSLTLVKKIEKGKIETLSGTELQARVPKFDLDTVTAYNYFSSLPAKPGVFTETNSLPPYNRCVNPSMLPSPYPTSEWDIHIPGTFGLFWILYKFDEYL